MQSLRRFPTAREASGFHVAHLLEATTLPQASSAAVTIITEVVGLLIQGRLPSALAQALTLSPLTALIKKDGGPSP